MLGKSRNDVFFNGWCVRMARKVGSLKRRARSPLTEGLTKIDTPPRREAHLEVKSGKTPHARSSFGDATWKICTPPRRLEVKSGKTPHALSSFGRCNFENRHAT